MEKNELMTFLEYLNQQQPQMPQNPQAAQNFAQNSVDPEQYKTVMGSQYRDKLLDILNTTKNPNVIANLFAPIFQSVMQKDPNIISKLRNQGLNMNKSLNYQLRNNQNMQQPQQ